MPLDKPIIIQMKEGNKIHLHVKESPLNIEKGHYVFHAFEKLKEENELLEQKGELEIFEIVMDEKKKKSVFESIEKSLDYYEKGETKASEAKKKKTEEGKQKDKENEETK